MSGIDWWYRSRSELEGHPLVDAKAAALRNAERAAMEVPFPYAAGTPVELATPLAGSSYAGWVISCDEVDGWLVVESADLPDYFAGSPRVRFHAGVWPIAIRDGVLVLPTAERVTDGGKWAVLADTESEASR